MAKRKIIWTHKAEIKLFSILEFYMQRNKSTAYPKRLYNRFIKELKLLAKQPDMGINTELENISGLIVEDFILFYEVRSEAIIVHTVWDCRQNPDDLIID